jgi:hypothetical protein
MQFVGGTLVGDNACLEQQNLGILDLKKFLPRQNKIHIQLIHF